MLAGTILQFFRMFEIISTSKGEKSIHAHTQVHMHGRKLWTLLPKPHCSAAVPSHAEPPQDCLRHLSNDQTPHASSWALKNISLPLSVLVPVSEGIDPYYFREDECGRQRPPLWGYRTWMLSRQFVKTWLGTCPCELTPQNSQGPAEGFLQPSPGVSANGKEGGSDSSVFFI